MIQDLKDIEKWYSKFDPWDYENDVEDLKRKNILLSEIPQREYQNVLDIGCGHGFITRDLPGENIIGVDISEKAIIQAKKSFNRGVAKKKGKKVDFVAGSIFDIADLFKVKFDLIVITGVLYPQYIGHSNKLIYLLMDKILKKNGVLVSVHIDEWFGSKFPYLLINDYSYDYRDFTHRLEVYVK